MPAQFIRDEAFAASPISRSGQTTRWSLDAVVAEAERDATVPGALRHVSGTMRPPLFLTSERPSDIARRARETAASCREHGTGKKIRTTANIAVSRVMSYPVPCAEFGDLDQLDQELRAGLAGQPVERPEVRRLLAWIVSSVRWSRQDLGDRGAAVVHLDEANPHCHHLVPIRERADRPGVADLSFWRTAANEQRVREEAREAGRQHQGREIIDASRTARKAIAADYQQAVGSKFGHALTSDAPRKRRKRRDHLEIKRVEGIEAENARLRARVAELEQENRTLRERVAALLDQGRAMAARARTWIGALRGDPAALRDAGEAPTLTEGRIDAALGVSQADLQRRRQAAI
ncbi:MAG: hypothetical protein U1E40_17615 [Amaricoccus sp.]